MQGEPAARPPRLPRPPALVAPEVVRHGVEVVLRDGSGDRYRLSEVRETGAG